MPERTTEQCINLQRSEVKAREAVECESPSETGAAFGGLPMGTPPDKGGLGRTPRSWHVTSSINYNSVYIRLNYMICVHGGPIYTKTCGWREGPGCIPGLITHLHGSASVVRATTQVNGKNGKFDP